MCNIRIAAALTVAALAGACSRNNDTRARATRALTAFDTLGTVPGRLTVNYPRNGTLFPPEFPPPTFIWETTAPRNELAWAVRVESGGRTVTASSRSREWKPEPSDWEIIKQSSVAADAVVTVVGYAPDNPETPLCSGHVRIRTSTDPVGAPILYRDVPLPFIYAVKNPDTIRWRLADVSSDQDPPVVLENLPVCGNCHSFDAAGRTLGMDVDYANDKGSYVITEIKEKTVLSPDRIITWSDYKREDGEYTFGLLSQVSPDGRYVVSTVKDRSVFVPRPDLRYSQLFFPIKGILAVYDREEQRFFPLPGADDPQFVQSNPAWSPDGKWIYFCRARAAVIPEDEQHRSVLITEHLAKHFLKANREFKYDIFRVPFNKGKGGTARPVPGAADNGMSNYFPKLSPDGKWLVFCRAANFMLLQPDSRLHILPAAGGEPRAMNCNTGEMNSWHSWSPNGKWLVFSTKLRGPYTQLGLTHIDELGNDTPPVLLEQAMLPNRACNIPEFLNRRPGAELALREDFLDSLNFRRQGQVLLLAGDFRQSIPLFLKALELDPQNHAARLRLAVAYTRTGRPDRAQIEFNSLLNKLKDNTRHADLLCDVHCHMALLLRGQNDQAGAIAHYRAALECRPDNIDARLMLGLILASHREFAQAERELAEAVRRHPGHALAHMWRGLVLNDAGRTEEARASLVKALSLTPADQADWELMGQRLLPRTDLAVELAAFLERYRQKYPNNAEPHILSAKLHIARGSNEHAIEQLSKAFEKDPSLSWIPATIQTLKPSHH